MTTTNLLVIKPVTFVDTMNLYADVLEDEYSSWSSSTAYIQGDRRIYSHSIWESLVGSTADVTVAIGTSHTSVGVWIDSPALSSGVTVVRVTWSAHGLSHNAPIFFSTTGVLPTGLVAGQIYYVKYYTANQFFLSATPDGDYLGGSDAAQSGQHTGYTPSFVTWPKSVVDDGSGGVTLVPHGWPAGTSVVLSTTGSLPTGLTAGTRYYVLNPTDDGFYLSSTATGTSPINTSGTQSGTHTARATTNYNRTPEDGSTVWSKVSPTNRYKPLDVNPSTRAALPAPRTVTISVATPAWVADSTNNFAEGAPVAFFTGGSLPTGIVEGTTYYVKNVVPGSGYNIAATAGGAAINTTGTSTGPHYVLYRAMRFEFEMGTEITAAFVDSITGCTSVRVRVTDPIAGQVYDTTKTTTGKTQAIFEDLPAGYPDARIRFDLLDTNYNLEVGVIGLGTQFSVGTGIQLGARLSHQSFSRQEANAFGDDILVPRGRARLVSMSMRVAQADVDTVWTELTALDSVPCMWRATTLYASLNAYGYFKTMEKLFDMQTYAVLQLTIKSMSTNT
jgi:hypothetical protein